jgi:DNA-directed RNA polymerase subunit RPC12/RpoP
MRVASKWVWKSCKIRFVRKCVHCGKQIVINNGNQKTCDECGYRKSIKGDVK